jgi:carbon storage regulator
MLVLSRKINESVVLGEVIEVKVLEVSGERVKIGISAPRDVSIVRRELLDQVQAENVAAAAAGMPNVASVVEQFRKAVRQDE